MGANPLADNDRLLDGRFVGSIRIIGCTPEIECAALGAGTPAHLAGMAILVCHSDNRQEFDPAGAAALRGLCRVLLFGNFLPRQKVEADGFLDSNSIRDGIGGCLRASATLWGA